VSVPPTAAAADLPVVYLTYDDGPAAVTGALLDLLAEYDAHVTFFLVGRAIPSQRAMVRRELAAGHAVANHSWSHPALPRLSSAQITTELELTNRAIRDAGGDPRCFRPPYGSTNGRVASVGASLGLHEVLWDVDTLDWRFPTTTAILSHLGAPRDGLVVLMHDGGGPRHATLEATRVVLERWKGRVRFEALPQCRGAFAQPAPPAPTPGTPVLIPETVGEPLGFEAVPPVRLVDTRQGTRLAAGETVVVEQPADAAAAAAVSLTVTGASAAGYLQAWDCAGEPATSVLNFAAREVRAGAATVSLAEGRRFCVRTSAAVDLIVDLTGRFTSTGPRAELTGTRVVDTRSGSPLAPGWHRLGAAWPAQVTAISAVVTLVGGGSPSDFVSLLPCAQVTDSSMAPPVSAANGATTVANFVQLGVEGGLCAYLSAPRHLLLDVVAEWGASGNVAYRAVRPTRVLDTRVGAGWSGPLDAQAWYEIALGRPVAGVAGTLTATGASGPGFASAVPCAAGPPALSTVQYGAADVAVATVVRGDRLCVYPSTSTHLLFDATGVFTS
jgi:hypothetical protein